MRIREVRAATGTAVLAFTGAVAAASVFLATWLVLNEARLGAAWAVAGLAIVSAFSERGRVKLGQNIEISISLLPALFAAVLFGPLASMIVFGASMLGETRKPALARFLYTCTRSLTGAATGAVTSLIAEQASGGAASTAIAAAAGAVVAESLDVGFASVIFALRGHGPAIAALRQYLPVVVTSIPFYMPVVTLLVIAYQELSPVTLPLFFVPALAAQRWFILYQEERRLARDLVGANGRLERANLSFAGALVATLDARDEYTAGHSAAVAVYAKDIAVRLGLSIEEQRLAHLAGLVHDIGKIGLPAGLLEKPGALTLDERRQMERHSEIGERILANVESYSEIAAIVRHHHERIDGQGYPDGVSGNDIPLIARIIAVADAYDAMTSDRPYRDAMPSRVARLRLAQAADTQFDTAVVAAFEAILSGAGEEYRSGSRVALRREHRDVSAVMTSQWQLVEAQSAS